MKIILNSLLAVSLLLLTACGSGPTIVEPPVPSPTPESPPVSPGQPQARLVSSELTRQVIQEMDETELAELVNGNSRFAFDLYQALRAEEGNLFYSPYSISLALAMTYAGARGETESQMAEALHFDLPQASLHAAYNALDQTLAARGQIENNEETEETFRLNIVNSLWGQEGYSFLPEYLDLLALNYGAGLTLVDFMQDPEAARQLINDWVNEQTEGRIDELIPQGAIEVLTRLVLVNAIYFNAQWAYQFEQAQTGPGPFYLLDSSQVSTPMMNQTEIFPYARLDGYQALEMPYKGHELSMVVLLPDQERFEEFEAGFSLDTLQTTLASLSPHNLDLNFPKFEFDASFQLADTLDGMGMHDAFIEGVADFSGMDGTRDLLITDVIHKAFVSVAEEGTEAAAATGVVVGVTSMPPEPVEVKVDRPFIFLIRDIETGAILFMGRVTNPGA